jgi:hypothetical protein
MIKPSTNFLRPLSRMEEALTIISMTFPFTVVCVLRVQNGPSFQALRSALDRIQLLHPLLNAKICGIKGNFWFEQEQEAIPIPLVEEKRIDDNHWLTSARKEINLGFDPHIAPLMKALYLVPLSVGGNSEIIISFHHAITDAISLLSFSEQLLTFASEYVPENTGIPSFSSGTTILSSISELKTPSFFRSLRLYFRLLPFIYNQTADELKYRISNRIIKDSVIPSSSENDLLTVSFSVEETTALVKWARRKKLSLYGIITASMLLVVNNYKYEGKRERMRTVQFANLRPYLHPPVSEVDLGSFIALMRFTVQLSLKTDIAQIAADLDRQQLETSRKGDKFIFAFLSKMLVKKTIQEHKSRLGATALSYAGPINLKTSYGNTVLTDIHGYITNNCLGAELTAFAKIFSGRLSLDINFLTEETSLENAKSMAQEIKLILLELAG